LSETLLKKGKRSGWAFFSILQSFLNDSHAHLKKDDRRDPEEGISGCAGDISAISPPRKRGSGPSPAHRPVRPGRTVYRGAGVLRKVRFFVQEEGAIEQAQPVSRLQERADLIPSVSDPSHFIARRGSE